MSDARSWRSSGSSRIAGGPIRPTVAPGGEPHRLATVAGLRLVGGASKALSGCRTRIAGGRTRTQVLFLANAHRRTEGRENCAGSGLDEAACSTGEHEARWQDRAPRHSEEIRVH